ncbi:hypothetical protein QZH41_004458 [Actinostola sp. cb2023]|nr:hypothetical protein QZH41_004458 [Actinostola sp. cb2023]
MNSSRSFNGTRVEKDSEIIAKSLQTSAYAVVFVLSFVGNSIVLIVMKKNVNGARKVVTNVLIAHMALADIITTICGIPVMIWRIWKGDDWIDGGIFGKILCKVDVFVIEVAFAVSAFAIALIALERYLVISYPTRKILTAPRAFGVGLIAWLCSAIFYSPKLYTLRVTKHNNTYACFSQYTLIKPWRLIEIVLFLALFFVTFGLYVAIIIKVRCYNSTTPQTRPRQIARKKMNRRVLCQSMVIIFVHYFCWIPYLIVYMSCLFSKMSISFCQSRILIRFLAIFFGYCNAAANPFVYATLSESFRSGFRQLIYRDFFSCGESTLLESPTVNQVNLRVYQEQPLPTRNGFCDYSTGHSPPNNPPPQAPTNRDTKLELVGLRLVNMRSV